MFKKYYKAANDDIKPNRQLIDKIFDETEIKTASGKKFLRFGIGYGTAVAAVLVITLSVLVYPQINRKTEKPQVAKVDYPSAKNTEINPAKDLTQQEDQIKNEPGTEPEKSPVNEIKEKVGTSDSSQSLPSASEITKTQSEDNVSSVLAKKTGGDVQIMTMPQSPEPKECSVLVSDIKSADENTVMLVEAKLKEQFGESDTATGNAYIFETVGMFKAYDKEFYLGRWRWFTDDHSSLICEFVLSTDFSEMYECSYTEDKKVEWSCSENLIN